jgi:hypothetical protein
MKQSQKQYDANRKEERVMSDEIHFPEGMLDKVIQIVEAAGEKGFNVWEFKDTFQILAAGYLAGTGMLEVISGGGREPYIVKVKR